MSTSKRIVGFCAVSAVWLWGSLTAERVGQLPLAAAHASGVVENGTTVPDYKQPPLGQYEKIRLGFTQWWHFNEAGVPDEELMESLETVGMTVFVDWAHQSTEARGRLAQTRGMRYYRGAATANMRSTAQELQARLAVDRFGLTCPEQFEAYKARGGNVNEPWGKYGEGKPAYVPCPLDRRPWEASLFQPALEGARQGWLDGLSLDTEPYGAYAFDLYGDMLCYCDDCFGQYLQHKNLDAQVERQDRYAWLRERALLEDYLGRLRARLIEMLQGLAKEIRAVSPAFGFAAYPDFAVDDLRSGWRLQGVAMGLNSPQAPFIVINSTPYWEDPTRPWWEAPHEAYRKLGLKHVMGSWDGGLMGHHPETEVGAAETMYELAMASDGFWRWGERNFDTSDWRSFALVHQRLRQVEARVGDTLLRGQPAPHFVTLVEQTGNPFLERALVARTFERQGRYLVLVNNGNTDWPVHVRLRFPRIPPPYEGGARGGISTWRLRDPIHEMDYLQRDGAALWKVEALREGVVVPLPGRGELFLLLEPVRGRFKPGLTLSRAQGNVADRYRAVRSFEVPAHRPRPEAPQPPEADGTNGPDYPPEASAGPPHIVFTQSASGGYKGGTANQGLVTALAMADLEAGQTTTVLGLQGFCWEPCFSPDRKRLAVTVYVNGKGQIYVINAPGGPARNVSNNVYCDHSPRFSPDGRRIVFVSDRDGDWEIYSMNGDGRDPRRLTHSPGVDRSPAYSPDGREIAFISNRGGDFDVYVMNADGSEPRVLVPRSGNEYEPTWSPDGQFLACTVQRRHTRCLQVCRRDGSEPYFVAHGPATHLSSIRFSPDGHRLAAAFRNFAEAGVLVVDLKARVEPEHQDWEGKQVQKIVNVGPQRPHGNDWYSTGTGSPRWVVRTFSGVSFSPDGNRLVYCSDQAEGGQFMLYTIPMSGGEATPVPGSATAWPAETDWGPG